MSAPARSARHPSGATITFDPAKHEYLYNGKALTSVTTLIKGYFPEFDGLAVATRKAAREGSCPQELLRQWDARRDAAGAFGSRIHLFAETIFARNDVAAADLMADGVREIAFLASLRKAIERILKYYDVIEAEKIVFSPRHNVAGTIDLLLRNKQTGEFIVADWKTGRKIRREAYGEEKGRAVFRDLPHCNHIHYSLQLHAYRELLLREAYLPTEASVRGILIHITDATGAVDCDFIPPRDLARHVRDLFDAHQTGDHRREFADVGVF